MNYHFNAVSFILFLTALAAIFIAGLLRRVNKYPKVNYLVYLEIFVAIIPTITFILIFTNGSHHLVYNSAEIDPAFQVINYNNGIWFWIYFSFAQVLIFAGILNLTHLIYKFSKHYKPYIATLLFASLLPVAATLMYISDINPFHGFNWIPISYIITGIIITLGIIKFQIFELIPFEKHKLFETIEDGIVIINKSGIIEDCNNPVYNIFNFQKGSVIANPYNIVFHEHKLLINGIEKKRSTIRLKIEQGDCGKFYQVRITPIYRNHKFSGNLLLINNITSIIKTKEELSHSNNQLHLEIEKRGRLIEELDSFAHTVAHDLRNSLGSIFSATQIMEEIIKQNDINLLVELTNLINQSAGKSIQITQELLILATTDKKEVECEQLNMEQIYNNAKIQLADLIKNSNAKIYEPEVWPESFGYAPWIEEVWGNYLSNAIKYGGTPPTIEVGADILLNNKTIFWIKDNGQGLSEEEQSKLFMKLVRLNPRKAEGYGLGLSIVKRIIEKLNGKAGVESNGVGKGSKFYFILPANANNDEFKKSDLKETRQVNV